MPVPASGWTPRIRSVATTSCIGRRIFAPFECLKVFEAKSSCSTGTIAVSCLRYVWASLATRPAGGLSDTKRSQSL